MKGNNTSNNVSPIYDNQDCHPVKANNHNDVHEITKANIDKRKESDNDYDNHIVFSGLCHNNKYYNFINVDKGKSTQVQVPLYLNEGIFISSTLLPRSSWTWTFIWIESNCKRVAFAFVNINHSLTHTLRRLRSEDRRINQHEIRLVI